MKTVWTLTIAMILWQTPATAQNSRLTPEILWSLGRVSLFDVSPDQQLVLYGVTYYDIEENRGNLDLFTIRIDGGSRGVPQRLTDSPESESNAQYRPDGQKIGFLRDGKLWEMNPDGSDQRQVSDIEMEGFQYSPDGRRLLYVAEVKYGKDLSELYPDLPKADARIIDDLMYRHWNSWEDGRYRNVFYIDYQDGKLEGEAVNIINEPFDVPLNPFGGVEQIRWSPDGKRIAYTCKKLSGKKAAVSTNSDLFLYELKTGETTNISQGMDGYDMEPSFSPSGRILAWNSMATPGYEADRNRIFLYDMVSKEKWEMTEGLDRNAHHPKWAKKEDRMYFSSEDQGTRQLYEVNFNKKGRVRPLSNGHYNYYDFIVLDEVIVTLRASMSMPHEIYRLSIDAARPNQITFTNKEILDQLEFGRVQPRKITTTDGKRMLAWMIYPPDFDPEKKYPALLYCQGGPQSTVSQFWSYRWNFQMMAAKDYIVVAPNRRGLPGFGQEWNDEIQGDWGGQAMQDLLTAIDDVKKEAYVDSTRLGAVGASFGGYSVYWLAGNHQKRFKTFISHCGLFNLKSWYGTTEEMFFANRDLEGPYWQEDTPQTYLEDSPHKFVRNWDTPILVIHGEKDFRVPVSEGMQAFQAAQLQDIPSRFLYFPEEGHWVGKPQNGILWQRVFFDWLDRYLKEEEP